MTFEKDGSFYFDIGEGSPYEEAKFSFENWSGTAEFVTRLDYSYPLGTLLYDIEAAWWMVEGALVDDDLALSMHLKGSYRIFAGSDGSMMFSHNYGDDIYQVNKNKKEFIFERVLGYVGYYEG